MLQPITSNEKRAISIVLIGAFLLRLYTLGSESLWLDETIVNHRIGNGIRSILTDWDSKRQGPLYPMLMRAWVMLFGQSEFVLRFPSVVCGTLGVYAIWLLGRRLFCSTAALFTAILASTNPFLIYFAQEARPYALWIGVILLSLWFFLRLLENPSRVNVVGYVLTTLAALYLHPYGPFLLVMHLFLCAILGRGKLLSVRRPLFLIMLGYLPMGYVFASTFLRKIADPTVAGSWLTQPTFLHLAKYFLNYFSWPGLALLAAVLLIGGLLLNLKQFRTHNQGIAICTMLIVCFMIIPWIISQWVPILSPRYTLPVLPSILLILGFVLAQMRKPLQFLVIAFVLTATVVPLFYYYTMIDKDPWRQSVAWLAPQLNPGDKIVLHPFYADKSLYFYFTPPEDVLISTPRSSVELETTLPDSGVVWFIAADYDGTDSLRTEYYQTLSRSCITSVLTSFPSRGEVNPYVFQLFPIEVTRYSVQPRPESRNLDENQR